MGRTFGERLHAERTLRHLTRTAFGEGRFTGLQIRSLEHGNLEPAPPDLEFLARRLASSPVPGVGAGAGPGAGEDVVLLGLRACQAWDERDYDAAARLGTAAARRRPAGEAASGWEDAFLAAGALRAGHRFAAAAAAATSLAATAGTSRDPARRARALALLATARQGLGQLPQAVDAGSAALQTALGGRVGGAVLLDVLLALIAALAESGRRDDAWRYCTLLLLPLLEAGPDRQRCAKGWWAAGNVAFLRADPGTGLLFHERAVQAMAPEEDLELWAGFHLGSASMRISAGLHDAGVRECLDRAETAQGVLQVPAAERLELLRCRGRYLHLSGDPAGAAGVLSPAYEGRDSLSPQSAGEVALQLGLSLAELGRTSAAEECLSESSRRFRRAGALERSAHAAGLRARLRG